MLSPGAKGWIQKYFDLVERGDISLELDRPDETRKLQFMHLTLGHSGIMFGYPLQLIFAKKLKPSPRGNLILIILIYKGFYPASPIFCGSRPTDSPSRTRA